MTIKRTEVKGQDWSWEFVFLTTITADGRKREVATAVPVLQILEIADQFRACPSGPCHTVYHLSHAASPEACSRSHESFVRCEACKCGARKADVRGGLCPTCKTPFIGHVVASKQLTLLEAAKATCGCCAGTWHGGTDAPLSRLTPSSNYMHILGPNGPDPRRHACEASSIWSLIRSEFGQEALVALSPRGWEDTPKEAR